MASYVNCSADFHFLGFLNQVNRSSRVVRLFGKKLPENKGFGQYFITDDVHPYERVRLSPGATNLKTNQRICIPGYSIPFVVQLYETPRLMYCC